AINARDAMPGGGCLTLETQRVRLDESYCQAFQGVSPGDYVLLAVTDTGCGMDEATRARVFEPFFTTKEPGRGTGLGLATVHGIVTQSGGHAAVYSEPGIGSTFRVYLPVTAGRLPDSAAPMALPALPTGTETVLLVEDEIAVRRLAVETLRRCGYRVLEAANGEEALERSAEERGPIDLLVTDVVMPRLGGRALAERFGLVRPGCRVLFMSGYADDAILRHGVLAPGLAFLQKPFSPAALAQKVRALLDATSDRAEGKRDPEP
ncbi:MAG: response regulator, partial [Acidobacteria bacterium]|nr:response regulator [Acidobacteriota bacterium]